MPSDKAKMHKFLCEFALSDYWQLTTENKFAWNVVIQLFKKCIRILNWCLFAVSRSKTVCPRALARS